MRMTTYYRRQDANDNGYKKLESAGRCYICELGLCVSATTAHLLTAVRMDSLACNNMAKCTSTSIDLLRALTAVVMLL